MDSVFLAAMLYAVIIGIGYAAANKQSVIVAMLPKRIPKIQDVLSHPSRIHPLQ
jgi:hypothetical protein